MLFITIWAIELRLKELSPDYIPFLPNNTVVIRAYQSYTNDEADQYYKKGNYGKSKELLQQTLEANPNLQAIRKLVNAHLNTGKKQEALGTIEFGLANFPSFLSKREYGLLKWAIIRMRLAFVNLF